MSGRSGPGQRGGTVRVQLPLLDRLIDSNPDQLRDPPMSAHDTVVAVRNAVRRDLEALLNARRRWRSWPESLKELAVSPIGYGMPDFNGGAFNDLRQREALRLEIEETIRQFEPRFLSVSVALVPSDVTLDPTLRLRVNAVMHAEPAPEPVSYETVVDASHDQIIVLANDAA